MGDPSPHEKDADWFTTCCRDPEFVKAYLNEQKALYMEDLELAVLTERERCAKLEGVPFADWLLDWFGQNAPTRYDDEEVGGYTFIQIADLSKMLEKRFTAAIREDPSSS